MSPRVSRRTALKHLGVAGAGVVLAGRVTSAQDQPLVVGGQPVEIVVRWLSGDNVRISVVPVVNGRSGEPPDDGVLADGLPVAVMERQGGATVDVTPRWRASAPNQVANATGLRVRFTPSPPTVHVERRGVTIQRLTLDAVTPQMSFLLPKGPLLGMGQGGAQFDRKGAADPMRSGQGGAQRTGPGPYQLGTHGARVPIQWLVGTDGWAMFVHTPYGAFDLSGAEGRFTPNAPGGPPPGGAPPLAADVNAALDVFVVASDNPATIMTEYARMTGKPELPAKWTLGYMQSHRTLGGPGEILGVVKTFREKQLPIDAVIYLGTEFAPSGWNTRNGEFTWHPTNFPDPKKQLDELHQEHVRVVVHIVVESRRLLGKVSDLCTAQPLPPGRIPGEAGTPGQWPPQRQAACYWPAHKPLAEAGVDGWWPDQGDGLDLPSRLARHRMYWEGSQQLRPGERPFALHRNGAAGMQRYAAFLWSGDVRSTWETLRTHVPIAVNTGLSGIPYWGTDIGGFNPTAEYTGELHVRWFQFGAFCPSFRSHGRNWHLRLPWGWNGGDGGPPESANFTMDPAHLKNAAVEPILKKYLELRYRLLPYTYTAVKETTDTGLPIMRALWLHYPKDPQAVATGDQFLWGRDILVAPVVERGATSRRVYLPAGDWFDFWTETRTAGGRAIDRAVDLETMPLYVRAGAIVPMGPVRQYADEPSAEPLTLVVYPGADGAFTMYDDDGRSFEYRNGQAMRLAMRWRNTERRLTLSLEAGTRMLGPANQRIIVRLAGTTETRETVFVGKTVEVRF